MKIEILKLLGRKRVILILFFLVLILIGIYAIFFERNFERKIQTSDCSCPINYGKPECINATLSIPFYNPNAVELKDIQVTAKKPGGSDIYNVDKPLIPDKTEVLNLVKCYGINDVKIKWCCDDMCCEAP